MQLGPGAFANDSPEPLYVEMNAMDFKPPSPAQKQESLYYATMDLFQHRTDLQVNVSTHTTSSCVVTNCAINTKMSSFTNISRIGQNFVLRDFTIII